MKFYCVDGWSWVSLFWYYAGRIQYSFKPSLSREKKPQKKQVIDARLVLGAVCFTHVYLFMATEAGCDESLLWLF